MAGKTPLGKPLALTDKELTKAAFVTEEDKEAARKFWRETAPEEFVDLLDAELVEDA
jgi:hypothetical protein